jgi:hypothetical protein
MLISLDRAEAASGRPHAIHPAEGVAAHEGAAAAGEGAHERRLSQKPLEEEFSIAASCRRPFPRSCASSEGESRLGGGGDNVSVSERLVGLCAHPVRNIREKKGPFPHPSCVIRPAVLTDGIARRDLISMHVQKRRWVDPRQTRNHPARLKILSCVLGGSHGKRVRHEAATDSAFSVFIALWPPSCGQEVVNNLDVGLFWALHRIGWL